MVGINDHYVVFDFWAILRAFTNRHVPNRTIKLLNVTTAELLYYLMDGFFLNGFVG